jgi:SOS-response transcriptional repressor LexA
MGNQAVGQRIRQLRQQFGDTIYALAEAVGVSGAAVSSWENGRARPSRDAVIAIAVRYRSDPGFIEFGATKTLHPKSHTPQTASVPIYRLKGSASTRKPIYEATSDEPLTFQDSWLKSRNINPARAACFRVYGDSMEPYLQDGDTILVDCADTDVRDGEAYALSISGELRVKRLRRSLREGLQILCDNPKYPGESVPQGSEDLVTVIGRVRWRAG